MTDATTDPTGPTLVDIILPLEQSEQIAAQKAAVAAKLDLPLEQVVELRLRKPSIDGSDGPAAAEASASPTRDISTQFRLSQRLQLPLRRPVGSDIVCFWHVWAAGAEARRLMSSAESPLAWAPRALRALDAVATSSRNSLWMRLQSFHRGDGRHGGAGRGRGRYALDLGSR